jgi:tRNA(Ile)-lysidine synthase
VAAREIRYAFFAEICYKHGFSRVALAHHLDDQAETFFINLMRRAGLKGLGGMPLKRDMFFRPLLFAHRADIELYAKEQNINYRNDSSNATDHYLRNSIRHHLLPALEGNLPGFTDALTTSMDHLTEADRLIQMVVEEKRQLLFSRKGEETRISVEALKNLQPLKTWLYYLLAEFGFHAEVLQSIAEALQHSESGKIFLSPAYKLVVDRFEVIVVPLSEELSIDLVLIDKECTEIQFPLHLRFECLDYSQSVNLKVPNNTALFDADQLHFPLQLRLWQKGDRFVPFGMTGSKLVSDFLIDQKMSLIDKEKVFVLVSGEHIIWVVGHRAGNHASVIENTLKVLRVSNE